MANTVAGIHGGLDTHANRPAGNAVPDGSLYSCSTHGLIYKSNYAGNSWATYATLGSAASGSITSSGYTQNTARLLGRTTASAGAIEEITVGSGLSLSAGSLTATGGASPTFVGARAYNSANLNSNTSFTAVTLDSERFDTNTFHDTSSNTSRLTVPSGKDGKYLIQGQVTIGTAANNGSNQLRIYLNGATSIAQVWFKGDGVANLRCAISTIYALAATDYVELQVAAASTQTGAILAEANWAPEFSIALLGT